MLLFHCELFEEIYDIFHLCDSHEGVLVDYESCEDELCVCFEIAAIIDDGEIVLWALLVWDRADFFVTVSENLVKLFSWDFDLAKSFWRSLASFLDLDWWDLFQFGNFILKFEENGIHVKCVDYD